MVTGKDLVSLIITTPGYYVYFDRMTREEASKWMRGWYDLNERIRKDDQEAIDTMAHGMAAMNEYGEDQETTYARWVIKWSSIVCMQIKEGAAVQERATVAMEKLTSIAEQEMKDRQKGEEWRGEDK